jgi:uncharacterized membrane protein YhaH (DUF805 family)
MDKLKQTFAFNKQKIGRKEFIKIWLSLIVVAALMGFLEGAALGSRQDILMILVTVINLALIVFVFMTMILAMVKRTRDIGWNPWLVILGFIPWIGLIYFFLISVIKAPEQSAPIN